MMGVLNHLSTFLLLSLLPPALSHVVDKFSDVTDCNDFFMNGTTPNLPGILVDGIVQNQNRYKPICQKYNNIYRFATLYDTTNRIPVFSAYTFSGPPTDLRQHLTGSNTHRPKHQSWMIEPQLEGVDIEEMNTQSVVKKRKINKDIRVQAVNKDYDHNNLGLHKGHIFPCSHIPDNDDDTKRSTFTLTNIVPQYQNFNQGRWKTIECNVRKAIVNNCNNQRKAYVVTGAVPNINKVTLNQRVNIPDLLWTAFCCENNLGQWVAGAHWGWNTPQNTIQPGNRKKPGQMFPDQTSTTLVGLYVMLNKHYGGGVQVFPDKCPKVDTPTALKNLKRKLNAGDDGGHDDSSDVQGIPNKLPKVDTLRALPLKDGGDEHDYCVYDDDCVCSSVGVKGYYLPVVFVSVLVMMM